MISFSGFFDVKSYLGKDALSSSVMYFYRMSIIALFSLSYFSTFSSYFWSYPTVSSLLILALLVIFLADTPKRNVDMVSWRFVGWGEQVIIKVVRAFPPNDS